MAKKTSATEDRGESDRKDRQQWIDVSTLKDIIARVRVQIASLESTIDDMDKKKIQRMFIDGANKADRGIVQLSGYAANVKSAPDDERIPKQRVPVEQESDKPASKKRVP